MNRPLTQKEIDLAPEWATHYGVFESDTAPSCISFYSKTCHQWVYHKGGFKWSPRMYEDSDLGKLTPIPRIAFDIKSVEWSDSDVKITRNHDGILVSTYKKPIQVRMETKQDIINKAKALGVTAEDLK